MPRYLASTATLVAALALASCRTDSDPLAPSDAADAARAATEQSVAVIVMLKAEATPQSAAQNRARAAQVARGYGLTPTYTYGSAIVGFAATVSTSQLGRLRVDPNVQSVTNDGILSIAAQTLPTGIDRVDGELSETVSGDGAGSVDADIAIIDTGIDTNHPDMNVVGGVNCIVGAGFNDGHGHGTHVAGIAAAIDDAEGVVGVAPGARLWAVKVFNAAGLGSWSATICGIDWVTENADVIEVANMSLGGIGAEPPGAGCDTGDPLHDAICRSVEAGVTYVVAAGNTASDAADFIPAAYDEVITVSALADFDGQPGGLGAPTCRDDQDDTLASFSNFGADIDLIAPGVCILSTYRNGYRIVSGTSIATPHVAGAAALYLAERPQASPSQVKRALQNSGTLDWNDGDDPDGIKEKLLNVGKL